MATQQLEFRRDVRRQVISLAGALLAAPRFSPAVTYTPDDVAAFASSTAPQSVNTPPQQLGTTYIGTPYYADLEFKPGNYLRPSLTPGAPAERVNYEGFTVIEPVVSITERKRYVETPVRGLDGSVIQYIGNDNPEVRIVATIIDPAGDRYPEVQLALMRDLARVPASLLVRGLVFERHGIAELVLRSVSFPASAYRNAAFVEIDAIGVTNDMIKFRNQLLTRLSA